jgi:hypothetical protein
MYISPLLTKNQNKCTNTVELHRGTQLGRRRRQHSRICTTCETCEKCYVRHRRFLNLYYYKDDALGVSRIADLCWRRKIKLSNRHFILLFASLSGALSLNELASAAAALLGFSLVAALSSLPSFIGRVWICSRSPGIVSPTSGGPQSYDDARRQRAGTLASAAAIHLRLSPTAAALSAIYTLVPFVTCVRICLRSPGVVSLTTGGRRSSDDARRRQAGTLASAAAIHLLLSPSAAALSGIYALVPFVACIQGSSRLPRFAFFKHGRAADGGRFAGAYARRPPTRGHLRAIRTGSAPCPSSQLFRKAAGVNPYASSASSATATHLSQSAVPLGGAAIATCSQALDLRGLPFPLSPEGPSVT